MPTHQNLMGLCWLGSQEDIRPPLGRQINQNAYAGGGRGHGQKVGCYVLCGAGVGSPHIIFIVLSYILEEVQSVSGNTLCVIVRAADGS